jgi:hypothetical protein
MAIHFPVQLFRRPQRYLSCYLRRENPVLIRTYPIPSFMVHLENPFMITQLRRSDWESHNAQLHIVRNNGDLRSKDLVGVPLEKN